VIFLMEGVMRDFWGMYGRTESVWSVSFSEPCGKKTRVGEEYLVLYLQCSASTSGFYPIMQMREMHDVLGTSCVVGGGIYNLHRGDLTVRNGRPQSHIKETNFNI